MKYLVISLASTEDPELAANLEHAIEIQQRKGGYIVKLVELEEKKV